MEEELKEQFALATRLGSELAATEARAAAAEARLLEVRRGHLYIAVDLAFAPFCLHCAFSNNFFGHEPTTLFPLSLTLSPPVPSFS